MTSFQAVTLALAFVGAVLGVMNTWNSLSQRKLRLRVNPTFVIASNGAEGFGIEIINLSTFAVTVTEVGILIGKPRGPRPKRAAVTSPIVVDGKPWPRRLEARETVSVYFDPATLGRTSHKLGKAYALTACARVATGESPALQQLREALRA